MDTDSKESSYLLDEIDRVFLSTSDKKDEANVNM